MLKYEIWKSNFNKINEMIDSINKNEKNRSEQMARLVTRICNLENSTQRGVIDIHGQCSIHLNFPCLCGLPKTLQCPFCNGIPSICGARENWIIVCKSCKSRSPVLKTKKEAIDAWNKRL